MKKLWLLLCFFVLGVTPALACFTLGPNRGWYKIENGQVLYQQGGQNNTIFVEDADVRSLLSIDEFDRESSSHDQNRSLYFTDYVSDINHVYYKGYILEGANPSQAVLLPQSFEQMVLIDGLDQYFSDDEWNKADGYLKDNEHVFYNGQLLTGANGTSFEWLASYPSYERRYDLDSDYARDDQHIYMYGQKVVGNPLTAYEIGYGYYLDDQHIYFRGDVLEGALPDDFKLMGVFIISNGHVYYRAEQLALDAASFQVLEYIKGYTVIGCGGTTYGGSFVQDHYGVYALDVAGTLTKLHEIEENDLNGQTIYAYKEIVELIRGAASVFYTDGHTYYFFSNTAKGSGTLEGLLAGDSATFNAYAALTQIIFFHDKTGVYISGHYGQPWARVVNGNVLLMCLEEDHLCLLSDDVLYYIFDDGTVEQMQVNAQDLQCVQSVALLSPSLAAHTSQGMCFDRDYFYNRNERQAMYAGGYEEALAYTMTAEALEEKRLESLRSINVKREPLLIETQSEDGSFIRWYFS